MEAANALETIERKVPKASQRLTSFVISVDTAATLLSASYAETEIDHLVPRTRARQRLRTGTGWQYHILVTTLARLDDIIIAVRNRLAHNVRPSGSAEMAAIECLAALTPIGPRLIKTARRNRVHALEALLGQLSIVRKQYEEVARIGARASARAEPGTHESQPTNVSDQFATASGAALKAAGGAFTLSEAADALGVTRQALFKRIQAGSALGMMREGKLVVPKLQFINDASGNRKIVEGLKQIVSLFDESGAGRWSALQFLSEPEPNLDGQKPIEVLKGGDTDRVAHSTRAFLHIGE
jgi:hypothetical protein